MTDEWILRLFTFRPLEGGATIDAELRDRTIPGLIALGSLVDAYVGRQGPDENGERLIASVWPSTAAMARELGDAADFARFHPDHAHRLSTSGLAVLPIAAMVRPAGRGDAGVLRVFRGAVRPGELDAYVAEARAGAEADAGSNDGLIALYVALERPTGFVTVSAWRDWSAIELATGGDVRNPTVTRQPGRLLSFDVAHYEILLNVPRPRAS